MRHRSRGWSLRCSHDTRATKSERRSRPVPGSRVLYDGHVSNGGTGDRMYAGQMVQEIEAETGATPWPVAQTYSGLSSASKELERLLGAGLFRHGGNPILRWMASVVEVRKDDADNIKPIKPDRRQSSTRIDGIAAADVSYTDEHHATFLTTVAAEQVRPVEEH